MAIRVDFVVTNNVTQNTGQRVLVFLTPTNAVDAEDYNFAAWQTLNPPHSGGRQTFTFVDTRQLAVENQETKSRTAQVEVNPNQHYSVTNENNQGPFLNLTNETPPSPKVTAVVNKTDPAIMLNSIWSVDNCPIVSQGGPDLGKMVTFELAPTLFFMVAIPTRAGFDWRLQHFSDQFKYIVPQGVSQVHVSWSRPGGMTGSDVLTFDPP